MKCQALLFPVALLGGLLAFALANEDKLEVNPEFAEKVAAALPESAPAVPKAERKVLIFSKTNGFRHGSIPTGIEALTQMGEKTGAYTAVHTEDESMFESESLAQFDAVIFLNTTGDVFRPKQMPEDAAARDAAIERELRLKKSLVAFVEGGGGLVGIHSATDTYHNWDEFNEMMGGVFAGHPWHEKVKLRNLVPDHPVNAAFGGEDFEVTDEIYQFREGTASASDRLMLLGLSGEIEDLGKGRLGAEGFYPVAWLREYGEGRSYYCSLGHRDEIFWNTVVLEHYLAGIQYALGDLEADATPIEVVRLAPVVRGEVAAGH
jgi:uncharacterized protein